MKISVEQVSYKQRKSKLDFDFLPLKKQMRIRIMIENGYGVYHIVKQERVSVSSIKLLVDRYEVPVSKMKIGSKDEEYATEEEMINGFQCTYDDLSESEKIIYSMK